MSAEQAKEAGRREIVVKNRSFFDFGSKEPIESNIVGEFKDFSKGRVYTLANGQDLEQTDAASLSRVRKNAPKVRIKPGLVGVWYLQDRGLQHAGQGATDQVSAVTTLYASRQ